MYKGFALFGKPGGTAVDHQHVQPVPGERDIYQIVIVLYQWMQRSANGKGVFSCCDSAAGIAFIYKNWFHWCRYVIILKKGIAG